MLKGVPKVILIGDSLVAHENMFRIYHQEQIAETKANSTIIFKYNSDILKYVSQNDLPYAVVVTNIKESIYANALNAKYIICAKDMAKDIQKIADELDFDLSDVEMLLDVFIETAEESLEVLNTAIITLNYDEIYNVSHSIKGSAGNLKLLKISDLAKKLELAAASKEEIEYKEISLQLSIEINKIKTR